MKKNLLLLSAIVLSGAMFSCTSSEDIDNSETKRVVNMLSEPVPVQLTGEQRVFVNDNNKFTLNFLKTVNETDRSGKSFVYSPLSITYALGMVNDAAIGKTEEELEQTLGFHQGGIQAVNEFCKNLIDNLPKVDDKVTLSIANAIFVNEKYKLKKQFEQDVATYYGAKAEALNFEESKKSASVINKWCNDKTNGMIPNIIDETNKNAVSYLLNAIYFMADWTSKFDAKNTKEELFDGKTKVPMMHQKVLISYLKNNTYSAVILPYGSGLWNMMILLPEEGKSTDDVINELAQGSSLNNRGWCTTGCNTFQAYEVDLKLPRYETESDTDSNEVGGLIPLMQKLGIHLAFDSEFSEIPNMCEDSNLFVSMMRQKAKIKVNEEGSEAAAVTIAGMELSSVGHIEYPKATFHANRPFVYAISENSSGVILFVGKFTGK